MTELKRRLGEWPRGDRAVLPRVTLAATIIVLTLLAAIDGWRTALLVGAAEAAVLLTRIRFSDYAALLLALLAALLIVTGPAVSR